MHKGKKILRKFQRTANLLLILDWASRAPFYGTEFMDDAAKRGHKISPGTLYPWLNILVEEGTLSQEEHVVDGKVRKYYSLTSAGLEELGEIKKELEDLNNALLSKNSSMEPE